MSKTLSNIFSRTTLKQLLLVALLITAVSMIGAHDVFAQGTSATGGLIDDQDIPKGIGDATNNEGSARALARTIVNFFLFFLGLVATIMVIYGGVLYVTAAGNDDQVGKAKNVILYAVVGIIVILISFALINTVLGAASGQAPVVQGTSGG